jgi:WhiB family transcriptional regulator, redox-sensing transcriptional regulator
MRAEGGRPRLDSWHAAAHRRYRTLVSAPNWRSLAARRSADPDLFFPVSSAGRSVVQIGKAKAICARCLVRSACLGFALRTDQFHGVWGGLTEQERDPLR